MFANTLANTVKILHRRERACVGQIKLTDFIQVSHKQCAIHSFHLVSQRIAENEPHISGGKADLDIIQKLFTAQDTIQGKLNLIGLGDLRTRTAISSPV